MAPSSEKITVVAKVDSGFHPKHGLIKKGQKYEIDERDYAEQLFDPPNAGYKPVWVREEEERAAAETAAGKAGKSAKNEKAAVEGGN